MDFEFPADKRLSKHPVFLFLVFPSAEGSFWSHLRLLCSYSASLRATWACCLCNVGGREVNFATTFTVLCNSHSYLLFLSIFPASCDLSRWRLFKSSAQNLPENELSPLLVALCYSRELLWSSVADPTKVLACFVTSTVFYFYFFNVIKQRVMV